MVTLSTIAPLQKPTAEVPVQLRLIKVIQYVNQQGSINNAICQQILGISRRTATRVLEMLVRENMLQKIGTKGGSVYYVLPQS